MSINTRARSTVLASAAALMLLATVSPAFAQGPMAAPDNQSPKVDPQKVGPIMQATLDGRFGKNLAKGDKVVYSAAQQMGQAVEMTLEVTARDGDVVSIVEQSPGQGKAMLQVNVATGKLVGATLVSPEGEETKIELAGDERLQSVKDSLSMMAKGQMPFTIPTWNVAEKSEKVAVGSDSIMCDAVTPDLSDPALASLPDMQKQQMAAMLKIYASSDVPRLIPFPVAMMGLALPEAMTSMHGGLVKTMGMELVSYSHGE